MVEPKTILIVDDDSEYEALLRDILSGAGYTVISADRGAKGIELARAKSPDMILLDIEMPEMTGYEVCKAIRADEKIKNIPVILVTILSKMNEVVKGLKMGADDHITKPYDPDEILMRMESVFRHGHKEEA